MRAQGRPVVWTLGRMAATRAARHDGGRVECPRPSRNRQSNKGPIAVAAELVSRLEPIVADVVAAAGFELDAIDVQQANRRKLVTVAIDDDDGIDSDELATASRAVSRALDPYEDLLAGADTL